MRPSRLDLPSVAQELLEKKGKVIRREAWEGRVGNTEMAVRAASASANLHLVDVWANIVLSIDRAPAHLFLPHGLIEAQLRSVEPTLDAETLAPDMCGMLLEMIFEPFIQILETDHHFNIECHGFDFTNNIPPEDGVGLSVSVGGMENVPVIMDAPPALRMRITTWLNSQPVLQADIDELVIPVSFRAGYAVLTLDELINIRPGDGIVMDANSVLQKSVVAVVGERFAHNCVVTAQGLELTGNLLTPVTGNLKGWTFMSDEESPIPGANKAEPGAVGQINVRLVFEVGRLDMTVEEIQAIDSGHVFDLGRPVGQAVDIIAGGRQIGAGELVRVGEQIGVRVDWILK